MLFTSREREKKELPIKRTFTVPEPQANPVQDVTVCYCTNRKNPRIEWFYESLLRQTNGKPPKIIVVDFYRDERDVTTGIWRRIREETNHVMVKPNVFCGPHRLTKKNSFAAGTFRNTGLLICSTPWIAFIDDLSVPSPSWMQAVREAINRNYIVLGAYKKVRNLVVENGSAVSYDMDEDGLDSRWHYGRHNGAVPARGEWAYGCSLAAPIEAFFKVNGWPSQITGGMGYEDCICGRLIEKHGYKFMYDLRMLTLEDKMAHFEDEPFVRADPGQSPNDKSHALYSRFAGGSDFPNAWPFGGIRGYREHMLNGGDWIIPTEPDKCWYTGLPWREQ